MRRRSPPLHIISRQLSSGSASSAITLVAGSGNDDGPGGSGGGGSSPCFFPFGGGGEEGEEDGGAPRWDFSLHGCVLCCGLWVWGVGWSWLDWIDNPSLDWIGLDGHKPLTHTKHRQKDLDALLASAPPTGAGGTGV